RSARERSAPTKIEPTKAAPRRSEPTSAAPLKLAPVKWAPANLRPDSSHLGQAPPKASRLATTTLSPARAAPGKAAAKAISAASRLGMGRIGDMVRVTVPHKRRRRGRRHLNCGNFSA